LTTASAAGISCLVAFSRHYRDTKGQETAILAYECYQPIILPVSGYVIKYYWMAS
jgi:hypothetical protein